ncbi:divalent Anion:Na+ symporter family [Micromonas pusilla CCMP1545]|uniref:Divalent Anion:Na+ symporter family n=1 Tax=Micromonas pusilla (strain CCMP1545) TaxID=564608 RepID=C1N931_MICPC|nr:divalent Anion:Na+ symporter family [Micromonas pusilla CCMP1545]EEH51451.1 divalent Anion:Na+ symporter family [Micromonas pusilla CCMP1545]|eukprot:XP_003064546.1 divalent Anion:Na+ symporter family [Micromonas pusilla CCMP1545]
MGEVWEGWFTVCVVFVAFGCLLWDVVAPDHVMMGALAVLMVSNVVSVAEGLSGFANEGLLTVAVLFVVAAGISATGGLDWYMGKLLGRPRTIAGAQLRRRWAENIRLPKEQVMMPLSFASILGGTCTLIGTSTNLVVLGMLNEWKGADGTSTRTYKMGLFDLGLGMCYVLLASRRLLPGGAAARRSGGGAGGAGGGAGGKGGAAGGRGEDLIVGARLQAWSAAVGRTVAGSGLRGLPGLYLVSVKRDETLMRAVGPEFVLAQGDVLYFTGLVESLGRVCAEYGLMAMTSEHDSDDDDDDDDDEVVEVDGGGDDTDGDEDEIAPTTSSSPETATAPGAPSDRGVDRGGVGGVPAAVPEKSELLEMQARSPHTGSHTTAFACATDRPGLLHDISQALNRLRVQLLHCEASAVANRSVSIWRLQTVLEETTREEIALVIDALLAPETGVEAVKKKGSIVLRVRVRESSRLVGSTPAEVNFRSAYNAAIVAMQRGGRSPEGKLGTTRLAAGDALVLQVREDSPLLEPAPKDLSTTGEYDSGGEDVAPAAASGGGGAGGRLSSPFKRVGSSSAKLSSGGGGGTPAGSANDLVAKGETPADSARANPNGALAGMSFQSRRRNPGENYYAPQTTSGISNSNSAATATPTPTPTPTPLGSGAGAKPSTAGMSIRSRPADAASADDVALEIPDGVPAARDPATLRARRVRVAHRDLEVIADGGGGGGDGNEFLIAVRVKPGAKNFIGKTADGAGLRSLPGLFLVSIERKREDGDAPKGEAATAATVEPPAQSSSSSSSSAAKTLSPPLTPPSLPPASGPGSVDRVDVVDPTDDALRADDVLWYAGNAKNIAMIRKVPGLAPYSSDQVSKLIVAALFAAGIMMCVGALSEQEARDAIKWDVIVTIAAAFGISKALQNSGVASAVANKLVDAATASGTGYVGLLVAVYLATFLISNVVTNNAAAALMFPIAAEAAEMQGESLLKIAFCVMLAASASFMSPFGYQTNLMVYGPGGYVFADFLRFGSPMQVAQLIVSVTVLALGEEWWWTCWLTLSGSFAFVCAVMTRERNYCGEGVDAVARFARGAVAKLKKRRDGGGEGEGEDGWENEEEEGEPPPPTAEANDATR